MHCGHKKSRNSLKISSEASIWAAKIPFHSIPFMRFTTFTTKARISCERSHNSRHIKVETIFSCDTPNHALCNRPLWTIFQIILCLYKSLSLASRGWDTSALSWPKNVMLIHRSNAGLRYGFCFRNWFMAVCHCPVGALNLFLSLS